MFIWLLNTTINSLSEEFQFLDLHPQVKTLWLGGSFSFGLDEPKLKILKYAPVMYYIETMERSLSWLGNN